jgi:hypothetical protein
VNLYPDLNRAVRVISKRLKYHNSSLVRGALSVTIAAAASTGTMPTGYWGLLGKPYISGKTYSLEPVPDQETKMRYTSTSIPIYYEMVGSTIYLYPGSTAGCTIKGDYWLKPTALTKPSDTMPYNELFDDVIMDGLVHIHTSLNDPNAISMFQNMMTKAVDEIVAGLDSPAPYRFSDGLGIDSMTNEGW